MRIIRAFPRRTKATPEDKGVRIGFPHLWDRPDEVHISVAFTWDIPNAEKMKTAWESVCDKVLMGGPAVGSRGGEFTSGLYIKPGYTITSRGCPNKCWFCNSWRRDGNIRELPIRDGWNVLDDNLLATSMNHFEAVCAMLRRQDRPPQFTGGLEAARLSDRHIKELVKTKPAQMFFAYDEPKDLSPLKDAGKALIDSGFSRKAMRCYVLIGYPSDTMDAARIRLAEAWDAGFMPMAMLYRKDKAPPIEWRRFQRSYARPASIKYLLKGA